MNLYDLPKLEAPEWKKLKTPKLLKNRIFWFVILIIFLSSGFGFLAGFITSNYLYSEIKGYLSELNIELPGETKIIEKEYIPQTSQEEKIIRAVKTASPAVVSIVVTKDVPIIEQYFYNPFEGFEQFFGYPLEYQIPEYRQEGTGKQEIGGGSGFIVSEDGMVITNKHVVLDEAAEYTIFTTDGNDYPAEVLARDPFQDLAVLKIEQGNTVDKNGNSILESFPTVTLGDSDELQIGQTVVAIGNVLGEFRNSISVGVVSGLGRTITAEGGGFMETIEDVIQTDAAINRGNSGGPLLNLVGQVIGINTAMVQEAQSIGFAIPINKVKKDIEQVGKLGKIVYPFLGIRYVVVSDQIQEEKNLLVNYGAWIIKGSQGESAVEPGSAADKAGLKENDIILEFHGEKITTENTLADIIQKYNPGNKITLKILRNGEEKLIPVTLGEKSE